MGLFPSSNIHPNYRSDHHVISLELKTSNYKRGRGSWKFNNNLLKNSDFIKIIQDEITLIKKTYVLPVYNLEEIQNIGDLNLELMISDSLFLDTMLCQLRGVIISFSKKLANETRTEEKVLEKEILSYIEKIDSSETIVEKEYLTKKLSHKQELYEDLREIRMQGHQVRSRSEIMASWEKPYLELHK